MSENLKSQDPIQAVLAAASPKTFADFTALSKKMALLSKDASYKKIRVGFLSSFTTKGLKEILSVKALQARIDAEIYTGDYNQYAQEILTPESGLYAFVPQIVILFIDLQTVAGERFFRPYAADAEDRKEWTEHVFSEIILLVEKIKSQTTAQIILHDFEVPLHSPLGILENKETFGFKESVLELNQELKNQFKKDSRVFVFEYDAFCSEIGKRSICDPKMVAMGDFKLDVNHMPALCDYYLGYLKAQLGLLRKAIVLDLDNTLWGGILGEEGIQGIRLGPTPDGRSFWEFQQHLLALFDRGIVLAINSRNNPDEVRKVLRDHPFMVLKERHFASMQINWSDKAANLRAIAKEINIGLDSLVFFDDDKINREWVKSALPEVLTVDLPEDPALYSSTLLSLNEFNTLQMTEEDQGRGAAYATDRLRQEHKKEIKIEDYLKSLQTALTVEAPNTFNTPRIAQLTQKTNQFNMTTRRYLETDINKFASTSQSAVWGFKVHDKFGDLGLIAVAIVEKGKESWTLDTFLMSCRVLGRRIEHAIFSFVAAEAKKNGIKKLRAIFIKTDKNAPAENFYREHGLKLVSDSGEQVWEYLIPDKIQFPEEVTLESNES